MTDIDWALFFFIIGLIGCSLTSFRIGYFFGSRRGYIKGWNARARDAGEVEDEAGY